MRVIHWFRSDLRIADNTALADACRRAESLAPVFVLDRARLERHRDARPRLRFLHACLDDLASALEAAGSRLIVLEGDPRRCIPALARACKAALVTWNRDYGPYAKDRDRGVRDALARDGVESRAFKDRVVFETDEVRTVQGGAYTIYTPFRRAWWRRYQARPPGAPPAPKMPPCIPEARGDAVSPPFGHRVRADGTDIPRGGAVPARERLDAFLGGAARRYHLDRDFPALAGTSRLSPYLRFGAISVRECLRSGLALAAAETRAEEGVRTWIDELVWREFYHAILDAHPRVLEGAFRRDYDALEWDERPDRLQAWQDGMTGYPIVDAGMRELAATGWMHNRARMIVASFLAKDLHIDWREGERWFMRRLVDGDPASNNGGWQWAASTGTDAQPYFRVFNPTSQGERFDPDGAYVRRWVPELEGLRGMAVHRPWAARSASGRYPAPIVKHAREREVALARFRAVRSGSGRERGDAASGPGPARVEGAPARRRERRSSIR